MQVRKYSFPTEKDMKHINRKLKSCWGHNSHDEYVFYTHKYLQLLVFKYQTDSFYFHNSTDV